MPVCLYVTLCDTYTLCPQFPSVSICNSDHLSLVMANRLETLLKGVNVTHSDDDNDNVTQFLRKFDDFLLYSSTFFQVYTEVIPLERSFDHMLEVYSRLGLTANIGYDAASVAGVQRDDFIVNCRFMDDNCNIATSFRKLFDPYYFNCFTFSPASILQSGASRLQGVEYGLSLMLFTGSAGHLSTSNEFNYLIPGMQESDPALASGQGARVVVHSPDTRPHPTAEGYDILPGYSVTVGVRASENARIKRPHGNCSDHSTQTDSRNNTYKYTLISCQNQCIQKKIMATCGCVDNRIPDPIDFNGLPYCFQLPKMSASCFSLDETPLESACVAELRAYARMMDCRKEVYEMITIRDPHAIQTCNCFPPCNDVVYDASYSLSTLPERTDEHTAFYSILDKFLDNLSPAKKVLLRRMHGDNYEHVMGQMARLNVYIADNNIIKTTESADYDATRLVSDIGGQLGLWIGISVMTLFEVIQLFADVLRYLTAKGRKAGERPSQRTAADLATCTNKNYDPFNSYTQYTRNGDRYTTTNTNTSNDVYGEQNADDRYMYQYASPANNRRMRYELDKLTAL